MGLVTVLAGVAAGLAAEGLRRVETERIGLTQSAIRPPRWPAALDGLRVLVVSDMHVHPQSVSMGRRERRLAHLLEGIECDLMLVPGDAANTRQAARIAVEVLRAARPRFGTFITFGNGEHKREAETIPIVMEMQQAGHLLMNDSAYVRADGATLWILGVDDPSEDRDRLDKANRGLPEDAPKILLAHSPEIVTRLHRVPVDLVVCGHTHGGQVCPPTGRAIWTQTQSLERSSLGYGVYRPWDFTKFTPHDLRRTRMFVSRGVGTAKLAVRAFCRPEVALLTLQSGGNAGISDGFEE